MIPVMTDGSIGTMTFRIVEHGTTYAVEQRSNCDWYNRKECKSLNDALEELYSRTFDYAVQLKVKFGNPINIENKFYNEPQLTSWDKGRLEYEKQQAVTEKKKEIKCQ